VWFADTFLQPLDSETANGFGTSIDHISALKFFLSTIDNNEPCSLIVIEKFEPLPEAEIVA